MNPRTQEEKKITEDSFLLNWIAAPAFARMTFLRGNDKATITLQILIHLLTAHCVAPHAFAAAGYTGL
jgi:hypothetical protein